MTENARLADRLLAGAVWLAAAAVTGVFLWLLTDLLREGSAALSFNFLVDEPRDAGRAGGIAPILVSTLLILGVCLAVALPLSLACAVYLAEYTRHEDRAGRTVRVSLDVLAGMPSIVFGLFGNALFCITLGLGFSILSGGLTLACMALPLMIRATEKGFRAVPDDYRSGAAALGLSRWTTLAHILLPAALPGLIDRFIFPGYAAARLTQATISNFLLDIARNIRSRPLFAFFATNPRRLRGSFGSRLERNIMPRLRRTRLDSKAVGFVLHLRAGRQDEIRWPHESGPQHPQ